MGLRWSDADLAILRDSNEDAGMNVDNLSAEWKEALARHAAAAGAYCETASGIGEAAWDAPYAPRKWSPAQITEHLTRTYDVVLNQLRGGSGLRVRSNWVVRGLLRTTVLRWIFRHRALPRGAKAPSEVVPERVGGTQAEAVARMAARAREFEQEVWERRGHRGLHLTHHLFGEIALLPGVDFVAIHIEHHHRQIAHAVPGAAAARGAAG
jgi:hypothetical protein